MDGVRINKALAGAGLGSRREVERWIRDGRLLVNGRPAELGQRIVDGDAVQLDGKALKLGPRSECRVLLYNKPVGELCTRDDPQGRPTVFDHLPAVYNGRWIGVGRLDVNTSGLLLFTTDGELANKLMHPSSQVEREYAVRVLGVVTDPIRESLLRGVRLDDGMASFHSVTAGGGEGANRWYQVVLAEGRQREVRRLFEAHELRVSRLLRVRFGNVRLPRELRPGKSLEMPADQIAALRKLVASPRAKPSGASVSRRR